MTRVDLTVMGGGIFGLSIAWEAVRRGARVRLIERSAIGAGSSGGLVGALAPHVPEQWNEKKAFQLESLLMAEGWWAEVVAVSGLSPGHARTGRLQPLADAAAVDLARARAEGAARLWQGRADWTVVPATGAAWEPVSPSGWLVHDTLTARIGPRAALAALAEAIRQRGGEVVIGKARTDGPVIWATGVAGLADLGAATGRRAGAGVKGQALLLGLSRPDAPQILADGIHIVPHADGTVAVGSTSERAWLADDATDGQLDALLGRAVAAMPALRGAPVVARWAGVRPRATSRAPLLGPWPGRPGHFVANGGFKIGFGLAPRVAAVMVDLALSGRDTIPEGFRVPGAD